MGGFTGHPKDRKKWMAVWGSDLQLARFRMPVPNLISWMTSNLAPLISVVGWIT